MEDLPLVDFTKVKKKQNHNKVDNELQNFVMIKKSTKAKQEETQSVEVGNSQDYSYELLLDRISQLIKKHNPKMTEDSRGSIKIPIPVVNIIGRSRSAWMNFEEVTKALNRPMDHLFTYVLAELGVEGTIGGDNQFLLKSKITNKNLEAILRKYIHDYVQCSICKSFNTVIKKDNSTRLQVISCQVCKSDRTVQPIKSSH